MGRMLGNSESTARLLQDHLYFKRLNKKHGYSS
jgi:hypothetical protein